MKTPKKTPKRIIFEIAIGLIIGLTCALSSCAFTHTGKYGTLTIFLTVADIQNLERLLDQRGPGDPVYISEAGDVIRIRKKSQD